METLETMAGRFEPKTTLIEKPIYEGLKLLEINAYSGPTSIKYWM